MVKGGKNQHVEAWENDYRDMPRKMNSDDFCMLERRDVHMSVCMYVMYVFITFIFKFYLFILFLAALGLLHAGFL